MDNPVGRRRRDHVRRALQARAAADTLRRQKDIEVARAIWAADQMRLDLFAVYHDAFGVTGLAESAARLAANPAQMSNLLMDELDDSCTRLGASVGYDLYWGTGSSNKLAKADAKTAAEFLLGREVASAHVKDGRLHVVELAQLDYLKITVEFTSGKGDT